MASATRSAVWSIWCLPVALRLTCPIRFRLLHAVCRAGRRPGTRLDPTLARCTPSHSLTSLLHAACCVQGWEVAKNAC